jgi:hypothetical protein
VVDGSNRSTAPTSATLALTYLTSYMDMGVVSVSCERACSCEPRVIDALQMAQPASSTGGVAIGAPTSKRRGGKTLRMQATTVDGSLTRNVSIAAVAEIPMVTMPSSDAQCLIKLTNLGNRLTATHSGQDSRSHAIVHLSKWKLLQVRVGWVGP